jgi:hypothetical protein
MIVAALGSVLSWRPLWRSLPRLRQMRLWAALVEVVRAEVVVPAEEREALEAPVALVAREGPAVRPERRAARPEPQAERQEARPERQEALQVLRPVPRARQQEEAVPVEALPRAGVAALAEQALALVAAKAVPLQVLRRAPHADRSPRRGGRRRAAASASARVQWVRASEARPMYQLASGPGRAAAGAAATAARPHQYQAPHQAQWHPVSPPQPGALSIVSCPRACLLRAPRSCRRCNRILLSGGRRRGRPAEPCSPIRRPRSAAPLTCAGRWQRLRDSSQAARSIFSSTVESAASR